MARSRKKKSAATYAQRLADDQYIHDQLREAASRLQTVYSRAARQRGKAAEDRKLYENVREAATSIRKAILAIRGKQAEPKRRGRKLLVVALVGGGAAVVLSERGRAKLQAAVSSGDGAGDEQPAQVA